MNGLTIVNEEPDDGKLVKGVVISVNTWKALTAGYATPKDVYPMAWVISEDDVLVRMT